MNTETQTSPTTLGRRAAIAHRLSRRQRSRSRHVDGLRAAVAPRPGRRRAASRRSQLPVDDRARHRHGWHRRLRRRRHHVVLPGAVGGADDGGARHQPDPVLDRGGPHPGRRLPGRFRRRLDLPLSIAGPVGRRLERHVVHHLPDRRASRRRRVPAPPSGDGPRDSRALRRTRARARLAADDGHQQRRGRRRRPWSPRPWC